MHAFVRHRFLRILAYQDICSKQLKVVFKRKDELNMSSYWDSMIGEKRRKGGGGGKDVVGFNKRNGFVLCVSLSNCRTHFNLLRVIFFLSFRGVFLLHGAMRHNSHGVPHARSKERHRPCL